MAEDELQLQNIAFSYGAAPVIRDVTYRFQPGRFTAICGPNGSGKSTLLGLAAGHFMPSQGQVILNGKDIAQMRPKDRALQMAMLPQSPEAPDELTIRQLVALGRYARRKPFAALSHEDELAIDAGLAATDIVDLAARPLSALSGGQRQRAWIAMILAQKAPLILLDEPTNHLDIVHAVETLDLLKMLVTAQGKTVIAVLHDLNLMASHCDDAVLMRDGQIVAAGAFDTTVTEQTLHDLYQKPFAFGRIKGHARPFVTLA